RSAFARHDALHGIAGHFDLVVSNPPYIPSADIETLAPEVRAYDPRAALDGGADGLDIYRAIVRDLPAIMRGWVLLEVGAGQSDAVAGLLQSVAGRQEIARF